MEGGAGRVAEEAVMEGLSIAGLAMWRERLGRVRKEAVMAAALAREAEAMAEAVREGLGEAVGEGRA